MSQDNHVDEKFLTELKIKEEDVFFSDIKKLPTNSNQSVLAIVTKEFDNPEAFECDLILVLINNSNEQIVFKSIEKEKFTSDAVELFGLKIDFAQYTITDNQTAFGIRSSYYGRSKPNPYSAENISLYLIKNNAFQLILDEFETNQDIAETDMKCVYDGEETNSILIMQKTKTNGYYDIKVKSTTTIKKVRNPKIKDEDCIETIKNLKPKFKTLRFVKGSYQLKKK